ncbi:uncharacterized protein LOC113215340 isoform X1 [Frankliniella occidentalis]|uniref:Uncharacterized protein LOC113215340 isoform X1 n=1 Tax=Frankliniella occidentalis TaxID=133901 RepID=A0A9C6U601_FRAOC|nr:uncharacterized protein LOC113215340 isoform X1 [Frankliniella occidentalis]
MWQQGRSKQPWTLNFTNFLKYTQLGLRRPPVGRSLLRPCILVALALTCQKHIDGKAINTLVGPYIGYVERFSNCEPPDRQLAWRWQLRVSHFNPHRPKELQLLTGNVTGTKEPFDNNVWMKITMDVRSNNQWKENSFIFFFKKNSCQVVRDNIPDVYRVLFGSPDVKSVCSIKPVIFVVNNTPVQWIFPNFPIMPYGHYRYNLKIGKDENLLGWGVAEVGVIPKVD